MEEQIQKVIRNLKIQYRLFWAIPVLIIAAGEFELFPVGALVDYGRAGYFLETLGIVTVAACVPLSLKLFSWMLVKKIDTMTFPVALKRYAQCSMLRLLILEVAILLNLTAYYTTLHSTGALCALIGLTASLFCMPSEKRLRDELHISNDND